MKGYTRKLALIILLLPIILYLSGCHVSRPVQSHVGQDISQVLSNSINTNTVLFSPKKTTAAKRSRQKKRKKIASSLVPKISVALDSPKKVAHRVNISANDMPIQTFFMHLVQNTKYDVVVDPNVTGKISIILNQVTIPEAIKAACDSHGFQYLKTSYGYRIQLKHMVSRIYKVNYLNINRKGVSEMRITPGTLTDRVASGGTSGSGSGSSSRSRRRTTSSTTTGGSSIRTTVDTDFWTKLAGALKAIIGTDGGRRVVVNADSGMIFVKTYPDEQRYVAKYLDRIQSVMQKQVIIEAKILEVHLDAEYQSGIQWKLLGLNLNGTTVGANEQDSVAPFELDNFYSMKLKPGTDFDVLVQLLNQQGRVEVLSSPHIATLNNKLI